MRYRLTVNLEKQKAQLDARIKEAGHSLNTEHTLIQSDISKLEARVQKLPELKTQLNEVQIQIRQLGDSETNLRQREQAVQELQAQTNYLEVEITRLKREISELAEKLDLLAAETEAKCPLCETELSREGLMLIGEKYSAERQSKDESLKSNQSELAQKHVELESLRKEKVQLEMGQEINETITTGSGGPTGYEDVGKVYKDPQTGKLILIQNT